MDSIINPNVRRSAASLDRTFAYAAALVAFGAAALIWPFAGAVAIGTFIGGALLVAGVFGIIAGLRSRHLRGHRRDVAVGLVSPALRTLPI